MAQKNVKKGSGRLAAVRGRVMTEAEAASELGVSPKTLRNWRVYGTGPAFRKEGRLVRYAERDVKAFADKRAKGQVHTGPGDRYKKAAPVKQKAARPAKKAAAAPKYKPTTRAKKAVKGAPRRKTAQ